MEVTMKDNMIDFITVSRKVNMKAGRKYNTNVIMKCSSNDSRKVSMNAISKFSRNYIVRVIK